MNSAGHFHEFWARDFGFCVDSLLKLGYSAKVKRTLAYALKIYSKHGKITTAISPNSAAFDFPDVYSPDSVAFFFYALQKANAGYLIEKYKIFLNKEVKRFYLTVLDKNTGLVKRKTHFSALRDYYIRDSSCYDNTMVALLAESLKKIKVLDNPFKKYDFKKIIKDNFWTGSYFLDDLSGKKHVAGDANVFPFWLGIFDDKSMLSSAITAMQNAELDKPFPLKYVSGNPKEKKIFIEFLVSGWERNCIWPHMGPMFISLVKKIDEYEANTYFLSYKHLIQKNRNFYELYTPDGKSYKSLFYMADEGIIWCANFLTI